MHNHVSMDYVRDIWHAFFGIPDFNNNFNVFDRNPLV